MLQPKFSTATPSADATLAGAIQVPSRRSSYSADNVGEMDKGTAWVFFRWFFFALISCGNKTLPGNLPQSQPLNEKNQNNSWSNYISFMLTAQNAHSIRNSVELTHEFFWNRTAFAVIWQLSFTQST